MDGQIFEADAQTLVAVLRHRAAVDGDRIAYRVLAGRVDESSGITYRELADRADIVASHLRDCGCEGERVVLFGVSSIEFIVAFFGALCGGAVVVPTVAPRPRSSSAARFEAIVRDACPKLVIWPNASESDIQDIATQLELAGAVKVISSREFEYGERTHPKPRPIIRPGNLALLQYTSGSTSAPKGVKITHDNFVYNASLIKEAMELNQKSVSLSWLPVHHDMGLMCGILGPMYIGCQSVLFAPAAFLQRPLLWLEAISHYGATISGGPNFAFDLCVERARTSDIGAIDLESWEVAFCGAEMIRADTLQRFAAQFERSGFRYRSLFPCYGLAEATLMVSGGPVGEAPVALDVERAALGQGAAESWGEGPGRRLVGCGVPLPGQDVLIVDPTTQVPCADGQVGEVWVRGRSVGQGYWNREIDAEETFCAYLAHGDERPFIRTGDLAILRGGQLYIVGRRKDVIVIRGANHYPEDIEATVEAVDPAIQRGGAAAFPVDISGEERLVVVAEIRRGHRESAERLLTGIRRAVGMHHEIEAADIIVVDRGALPKTTSGKIQRKRARSFFHDGVFRVLARWSDMSAAVAQRRYEPPEGETEQTLAALWQDLLKIDRVGRHDNFFELGGHSLLAVTLVERIRRQGLQVDVQALFHAPTVAGLAEAASQETGSVAVPPNLIPPGCTAITPDMLPLVSLNQTEIEAVAGHVPGGMANVQDIYPLAPLQEGILFHHLLGGEGDTYLTSSLIAFDGRERLDKFVTALQAVIARHDILRTAVVWEGLSQPVQVVCHQAPLPVEELTLDPAGGDAEEQLRTRLDPRRYRLDVRRAPLLRILIAQDKARDRWLLLVLHHHLVMDHTTLEVLVGEVQAHVRGQVETLPAPIPFRRFVARARLGVGPAEHEAFFRAMLADVDEPVAPFGLLDVQGDGSAIEEARLPLAPELAARLREQARGLGVSAASLFHLAWGLVVARSSGRRDAVFGTVLLGRMQGGAGVDRAPGMFINTLPLRVTIGEEGVAASVRRVQAQLAELLRHEHAALALAQRCSGVPAPAPLFTALLNYRHSRANGTRALEDWDGIELLGGDDRTNYPVTVSVDDLGEGFVLTAQTLPAIGAQRLCGFMETALSGLAEALEQTPDVAVRGIDVLSTAERHQVVAEWNATAAAYPSERCLHELFEAQAARTPDAVAVVFEDTRLSYAELNVRANRLAHHLRRLGVGPDARVALCVERSAEMVVALFAVLKAGGAYVPLDPAYPRERLAYMLADSAPVVLLTDAAASAAVADCAAGLPVIDLAADDAVWAHQPPTNLDPAWIGLTPQNLAYVIYTSGSTGAPKGVMVNHQGLVNDMAWIVDKWQFHPSDVILQQTPIGFDASVRELFAPLLGGSKLVLPPPNAQRDPRLLIEDIIEAGVTIVQFVPSLLRAFLADDRHSECKSLRTIFCGGEALSPELNATLFADLGTQVVNAYGPTETTIDATAWVCQAGELSNPVPIGRPIANAQVYLLDEWGEPVPVGVAGEIHIGGAGVARGYLGRPALTAERFVADPFGGEVGARMYRTGDLGRFRADGAIEFLGRSDFQVKIRGFRIELDEIEARLTAHAGVRTAVVVAREDSPGDKRLVAYYTGEALPAEALRRHLAAALPDYMLPAAYVRLDALPLTPNGKLDRRALPAPDGEAYAQRGYAPPEGETEQTLAVLWQDLLKVDRVGRHDNFFELGGHSLLAVTLASALEQQGMDISVAQIFTYPTIEALVRQSTVQDSRLQHGVVPLRAEGAECPLFLVHETSGEVLYGPRLTNHIDAEIPVYGLVGEPMDQISLLTVEGMAARLVRAIRLVQPIGPYRIAGWSFGGTLAYAIATQLLGEDEIVEFLGLIDTHYRPSTAKLPPEDDAYLRELINYRSSPDTVSALSAIDPGDFPALMRKAQELALVPQRLSISEVRQSLARQRIYHRAGDQYDADPSGIPIHLFIAQDSRSDDPARGWRAVVPDEQLFIIPVPGDHWSIMRDPDVARLGLELSRAIRHTGATGRQPSRSGAAPVTT